MNQPQQSLTLVASNSTALVPTGNPEHDKLRDLKGQIAVLKVENEKFHFDYADEKQNEAARSHIAKLRKSKAEIERTGKAARDGYNKAAKAIIAEQDEAVAEVQAMIDFHNIPLQEFEAKEEKRKADIQERINKMVIGPEHLVGKNSGDLIQLHTEIALVNPDEGFDEFKSQAFAARIMALEYLQGAIKTTQQAEKDALELEQLRKEREERRLADEAAAAAKLEQERIDREAKEKADREEADRLAAEQKAKDEADRLEREKEAAAEAARVEAAAEAERVAAAAAAREKALKDEADRAAQALVDAEERRVREAAEAEARQAAAVQAEADRIQRERDAKDAEDARRAADVEHRRKFNQEVMAELQKIIAAASPDASQDVTEIAKAIVIAICSDQIPHTKITY